jgi:serine phosphatase RsbU (regulator of sigma subunit)
MNIESALVRRVQTGEGLLEKSVTAIEADKEGIWAGTKNGLCCIRTAAGGVRWYTISKGGLPHNNITDLFSDRTGRLWVATNSNTIASIYDGRVTRIPFNSGSGIKVVGSLTEDAGNRIWVGSRGNGVFVLSPDSAMHLTENEGLFSDFCYSVACDSSRNIWIGHKNGISRISTSDYSVNSFTKLPGVPDDFSLVENAIVAGRNDMIYFGSDKGLIRFNSALDAAIPVPPVLGFTSVRINNEEISPDKSQLILPPGNYQLTVSYLGVDLKEPDHVIYHYKLDGYDEVARSTKSTSVTYGRLTQGKYVFRLSATNGEGIATESTLVLGVQIREPLWKQWWFWLSLAGASGLIVFILIRLRLARLIAEKSILEEKVIERTSEIRRQKSEIESQRDMIEMKNINITSSISYASQIQQALLPPAEMLENLLPDSFLFTRPRDIVSGDFYWLAEKDGKVIFTVADCTGHGVPGAFMSLLGITLLNEIVKVHGIIKPDEILKSLYEKVNQSVLQNRTENITKDGMDIAVCALDKYKRNLQFSGGMHDLVHIRDGNLSVLRADRSCISPIDTSQGIFSVKELDYKEADMIFLFSDGYQDQFGGEKNKKFLRSRFYSTLTQISTFPVSDQKEILETTLKWWMNGEPQTDDITVLGIRLH